MTTVNGPVVNHRNLLICLLVLCILYLLWNFDSSGSGILYDGDKNKATTNFCRRDGFLNSTIITVNGAKSYADVLQNVYDSFGYEFADVEKTEFKLCTPEFYIFPLKNKKLECLTVFAEWMNVQINSNITVNTTTPPPKEPPPALKNAYLLNGMIGMSTWYFDEIPAHLPKVFMEPWTQAALDPFLTKYNKSDFNGLPLPYGGQCLGVFYGLKYFKPTDQTGMVIGSQTMWVESMVIFHGAKKIYTVEYAPLNIQLPMVEYLHPITLVKEWEKYQNMDFIASFSSIEHSGLGRYGDPLDPIGDLRELNKIWCLLKPGGLLYLGLPTAVDHLVWNAHRMYGDIRWPMIAANFEFMGAFLAGDPHAMLKPPKIVVGDTSYQKQYLYVLRKRTDLFR